MSKFSSGPRPNMWWMVLLLVSFAGALSFSFFNRANPGAWGIPFFVWYQFLWIAGSALVTGLVCFKTTARPRPLAQNIGRRIVGEAHNDKMLHVFAKRSRHSQEVAP
jgi:Protein of unknown function (DUF3311)